MSWCGVSGCGGGNYLTITQFFPHLMNYFYLLFFTNSRYKRRKWLPRRKWVVCLMYYHLKWGVKMLLTNISFFLSFSIFQIMNFWEGPQYWQCCHGRHFLYESKEKIILSFSDRAKFSEPLQCCHGFFLAFFVWEHNDQRKNSSFKFSELAQCCHGRRGPRLGRAARGRWSGWCRVRTRFSLFLD